LTDDAMKIRTLIPAIMALVMMLGAPFGVGPARDPDPHGGLVCYCCSAMGKHCAMISCSGCCGSHNAGVIDDRWSPEMTLDAHPLITPLQVVYSETEATQPPPPIYLEVPERPPNRA
jgi:hypothetical protein